MAKFILKIVFILTVLLLDSYVYSAVPEWDGHDISTLKLLQIVHRHGERTVLKDNIPKTDPFLVNVTQHWPEGFGQLTTKGKTRMYRMGRYLREWYKTYLSSTHSPRKVYARSSIEHRCIESVSSLLSGMYPPQGDWKWDSTDQLGQIWQPFPIETFMPKDDDTVLVPHKKCPKADDEHKIITDSEPVKKIIADFHNSSLYGYLKDLFKDPIDSLYRGQMFWDTLKIESDINMTWPIFNTSEFQEEVINALEPLGVGSYMYDWNREFILKIRLGQLIEILISNMNSVINQNTEERKEGKELYIYSTHDSIVVPLMQALGHYNNMTPPYGGALLFELHEKEGKSPSHFVRIYYFNETDADSIPIPYPGFEELDFKVFESSNKKWYYSDFDQECGLAQPSLILSEMTFMVIGIGIGIGLLGLNIFAFKYIRGRKNSFEITK